jgi:hypothetical protein
VSLADGSVWNQSALNPRFIEAGQDWDCRYRYFWLRTTLTPLRIPLHISVKRTMTFFERMEAQYSQCYQPTCQTGCLRRSARSWNEGIERPQNTSCDHIRRREDSSCGCFYWRRHHCLSECYQTTGSYQLLDKAPDLSRRTQASLISSRRSCH